MQSQESLKMEGEGSREFRMQPPDGGWGNVSVEEWLEVSWLYRRKGGHEPRNVEKSIRKKA